ncbi:hypothetical protein Y032_0075g988 [Ancylostoma ceylanicum]|uniref:Uncharacterized protein n=1 Tax=Ancylostoma ceylanicum TaxID=53326 RepID=A0A016TVH3_9BILA|nr:hypothetical protein Y032_0075g988 [Ancylostoma ceylanicum]
MWLLLFLMVIQSILFISQKHKECDLYTCLHVIEGNVKQVVDKLLDGQLVGKEDGNQVVDKLLDGQLVGKEV